MALDPRLSLAGTVTDVGTAVSQGLASRDKARTQGVRERLLKQQEQMGAQEVASMQGQYMNQLASNLMGKPMDQRAALVAQQLPFLSQMGINPQQIIGADLSDQGLQSVVTQTRPFMQSGQGSSAYQFGATQTIKDDQGNLFSATQVRDPSTGQISVARVPIEGQLVSGIGETASERQAREVGTAVEKTTGTGVAETDVLQQREDVLRPGEVETARALQDVEIEGAAEQRRATAAGQFISNLAKTNQDAARNNIRLTEAMQLAQQADQGLTGFAKLQLSKLPGMANIDIADGAALDSALKSIALDQLQKFKGPTTDFEFGVVQDISGDLLGSARANQARIASLQRASWFQREEFEQAKQFMNAGGDPNDFAFNFEAPIQTKKFGSITLRDLQETAVAYNMGIEEALELMNKQ